MKKLLLLALVALTASLGFAQTTKDYTDDLATVNGAGRQVPAGKYTARVERTADGKLNITIRNFYFSVPILGKLAIGNIVLNDIPTTTEGNVLKFEGDIAGRIVKGDDPSVKSWMGPSAMPNPQIKISGKVDADHLYFTAQIPAPIGTVTTVFGKEDLVTALAPALRSGKADVIYSLDGRRLDSAPQHGAYILNGKKVMK